MSTSFLETLEEACPEEAALSQALKADGNFLSLKAPRQADSRAQAKAWRWEALRPPTEWDPGYRGPEPKNTPGRSLGCTMQGYRTKE